MKKSKFISAIILCYFTISCSILNKVPPHSTEKEIQTVALADRLTPKITDSISNSFSELDDLYQFSNEMEQIDIDSLYDLFETVPASDRTIFSPNEVRQQIEAMEGDIKIQYNNDIQRNINKLTSNYGRKYLSKVLAISKLYFPIIENIFKEENIPDEMKYAAVIESGLTPNIRSRAGAVGFWQFMYSTGKISGLEINSTVDTRCDIIASTKAAAQYMKKLYNIYGNWLLVLAAYNSGPGNVNKALARNKNIFDFWTIKNNLPRETRKHIPRFIATFYTFHYHTKLMIAPNRDLVKINTIDTVLVDKPIHLGQIASSLKMQEKDLALLNRQYLKGYIPSTKNRKKYTVYLPDNKAIEYRIIRNDVFAHKRNLYYSKTGKHIARNKSYYPAHRNEKRVLYRVRTGDYLGRIARKFGVSVKNIKKWNHLRSNNIRAGQRLKLYGNNRNLKRYTNNKSSNKKNKRLPFRPNKYVYHTVKRNESCWSIAQKYAGVTQRQIMKLNHISNPNQLQAGQKIRIKAL